MAKPDKTPKPAIAPAIAVEPELPPEPVEIPLRVSVIAITHNQVDALRRTLASVERSEPRQMLEILVVDAGSEDTTRDIEGDYSAIKLLRTPKNFGWTKSANIGTRTAKGEYLFIIPPGVEVQPDTVALLAARLDAESDVTVVCPLERNAAGDVVGRCFTLPTVAELSARVSSNAWPMAAVATFQPVRPS